jgi:hypothetical protein
MLLDEEKVGIIVRNVGLEIVGRIPHLNNGRLGTDVITEKIL